MLRLVKGDGAIRLEQSAAPSPHEDPPVPAFACDITFLRKDDPAADAGAAEQRLVYGIVLEPETTDSQGDIYDAAAIESAAHGFMANYQNVGHMHTALVNDGAEVVESYIAPVDFELSGQSVKLGTWVLVVHISSDLLWDQVKSGELTGFSIGGYAERSKLAE